MKFLLLSLFCIVIGLHHVHAQVNNWFKGTWYGERTFPDSRIAVKALIRMEVDAVKGNLFTGRLIYMYPSDTSARLIRKVSGQLRGKSVIIKKGEEIYRMDPRSRSFWSDCSHCPGTSTCYIENGILTLQITASACGDTCNGATVFRRSMQDYDAGTQAAIIKAYGPDKITAMYASYKEPVSTDTSGNPPAAPKDSLKYFPNLLKDSMGVHFDPNKYVLPNRLPMDTVLTPKQEAVLNKMSKQTAAAQKQVNVKDSTVNKKGNAGIVINKAVVKDSTPYKIITKDTTQSKVKAVSKPPAHAPVVVPQTATKDTNAAVNVPVKDTVPAAITQRTTSLVTTYQVSSPHISVQLFDDGQIDGDAVSVYYNGKVIINNQTLTHKAITFMLEASAANRHHEFILISESEGFLPPNTALMRIKAGSQQFELNVSSSSARNAKIAIDYTGE